MSIEEPIDRLTAEEDLRPVPRRVEFTGDRAKALEIDRCAGRLWEHIDAVLRGGPEAW